MCVRWGTVGASLCLEVTLGQSLVHNYSSHQLILPHEITFPAVLHSVFIPPEKWPLSACGTQSHSCPCIPIQKYLDGWG